MGKFSYDSSDRNIATSSSWSPLVFIISNSPFRARTRAGSSGEYCSNMAPSLVEASVTSSSSSEFEKPLPHDTYGTVVVEHHRSPTRLLRYWIHFAAVGVTVLLSLLNFLNVSLMVSEASNKSVVLNLFQFAAKAHELLILGSLSLLLLDSVRNRLITEAGVPLGYVLSPALFNDLGWLTSRHFWSCLKANNQSLSLVLLMMTAIPFANLSGPLSAITVVPRLGMV